MGYDLPKYDIKRFIAQNGEDFKDGSHIIYVNGAKRHENTALSILMHDFFCKDAKDIKNAVLANRVRHFLEDSFDIAMTEEVKQEVDEMCNLSQGVREDGRAEGRAEGEAMGELKERKKIILNMLNKKRLLSDILDITEASKDDVLTIAKEHGLEVVMA